MDGFCTDDISNAHLDSFLADLRGAMSAHLEALLSATFTLCFPALGVQRDCALAFDVTQPCRFEALIKRSAHPAVDATQAFRTLLSEHRALHVLGEHCLAQAAAKRLQPAELSDYLHAEQRFQALAEALRADAATALIDVDEVTGLLKRHAMERELREEHARARRGRAAYALAMVDIDHFKQVNDRCGHPFGDQVLAQLAQRLKQGLRRYDRVYRYGGEEFLVLLPDTPCDKAHRILDRLRKRIGRSEMGDGELRVTITLSIGIAPFVPRRGLRRLIADADGALYRAKRSGRNRVEIAD